MSGLQLTANKLSFQYTPWGRFVKKIMKTKLGSFIGFHVGITGFNRLESKIGRFQRYATLGEKLKKNEYIKEIVLENGSRKLGVYVDEKSRYKYNSRVDIGAALTATLLSGSRVPGLTAAANFAQYIALSQSTLTAAKGDSTLLGETAVSGLTRVAGSVGTYTAPSTLDGAASYILSKVFTAGGAATINSAAIFDAASSGNLFVEANLSTAATLATNDTLTINWTVNL